MSETPDLLSELKSKLCTAESTAQDYQCEIIALKQKLTEAMTYQDRLEDELFAQTSRNKILQEHQREELITKKELKLALQHAQVQAIEQIKTHSEKEEKMAQTVRRLRGDLLRKGEEVSLHTYASGEICENQVRNDQVENSHQRDCLVESLRLELAENQIKTIEMENAGDVRVENLERRLTEIKIENARLIEDNESFQLLLSERTLNGVLAGPMELMQNSERSFDTLSKVNSLAEELDKNEEETVPIESQCAPNQAQNHHGEGSVSVNRTQDQQVGKEVSYELKALQEQNRALSLYVEKIIGRLLEHKDFENIFDRSLDPMVNASRISKLPIRRYSDAEHTQIKGTATSGSAKDASTHHDVLSQPKDLIPGGRSGFSISPMKTHPEIPVSRPALGSISSFTESAPGFPYLPEDSAAAPGLLLSHDRSNRDGPMKAHPRRSSSHDLPKKLPVVRHISSRPSSIIHISHVPNTLSPSSTSNSQPPRLNPMCTNPVSRVKLDASNTSRAPDSAPEFFSIPKTGILPRSTLGSEAGQISLGTTSFLSSTGADNQSFLENDNDCGSDEDHVNDQSLRSNVTNVSTGAVTAQNKLRPLRLLQESPDGIRKKANRGSWLSTWMGTKPPPFAQG